MKPSSFKCFKESYVQVLLGNDGSLPPRNGEELISSNTLRVLVVDDSSLIRKIHCTVLIRIGINRSNIVEAEEGFAALEHLTTQSFDILITDKQMAVKKYLTSKEEEVNGLDGDKLIGFLRGTLEAAEVNSIKNIIGANCLDAGSEPNLPILFVSSDVETGVNPEDRNIRMYNKNESPAERIEGVKLFFPRIEFKASEATKRTPQ